MWSEIRVQPAPFDPAGEEARLRAQAPDAGALVTFQGMVRGGDGPVALSSLTLEHYPGVTEGEIAAIAAEAARRWPLLGAVVVHRVGRLLPGEPIVLVQVAARHRAAAFAAAEFLMDYLKTRAPFWKHEAFADGSARWVAAHDADALRAARWERP